MGFPKSCTTGSMIIMMVPHTGTRTMDSLSFFGNITYKARNSSLWISVISQNPPFIVCLAPSQLEVTLLVLQTKAWHVSDVI